MLMLRCSTLEATNRIRCRGTWKAGMNQRISAILHFLLSETSPEPHHPKEAASDRRWEYGESRGPFPPDVLQNIIAKKRSRFANSVHPSSPSPSRSPSPSLEPVPVHLHELLHDFPPHSSPLVLGMHRHITDSRLRKQHAKDDDDDVIMTS